MKKRVDIHLVLIGILLVSLPVSYVYTEYFLVSESEDLVEKARKLIDGEELDVQLSPGDYFECMGGCNELHRADIGTCIDKPYDPNICCERAAQTVNCFCKQLCRGEPNFESCAAHLGSECYQA